MAKGTQVETRHRFSYYESFLVNSFQVFLTVRFKPANSWDVLGSKPGTSKISHYTLITNLMH